MKKRLIIAAISWIQMCSIAFATPLAIPIKAHTFEPIHWKATVQNGGFVFVNDTNKAMYVLVTIESGEIYVYTQPSGMHGKCAKSLEAGSSNLATLCELLPNEVIYGDLDFSRNQEAAGTYQIEMAG